MGLCTFREGFVLNFDNLSSEIEFKRLNRFPCIMFKIDNISCILFKNGKIILTGIKTHEQIPPLKQKILETLEILKIPVQGDIEITIQNLVAMTNLHKTINLEMLCLSLDNCIYEPEQFPAAIVKKPNKKGVFLIFSNSKIIILGLREVEVLEQSLLELIKNIYEKDLFVEYNDEFEFDFDIDDEDF